MAQDWLQALHTRAGAVYTTGQMEKGKEGTIHLQYFVQLGHSNQKRITGLKKLCKHSHWEPVNKDNGAAEYCNKEDTRLEGPWTYGTKPTDMTNSEENKKRRKLTNEQILDGNMKELIDTNQVSLYSLPCITKAIEQYNKLNQVPAKPLD